MKVGDVHMADDLRVSGRPPARYECPHCQFLVQERERAMHEAEHAAVGSAAMGREFMFDTEVPHREDHATDETWEVANALLNLVGQVRHPHDIRSLGTNQATFEVYRNGQRYGVILTQHR
jgi:hypothetical protein